MPLTSPANHADASQQWWRHPRWCVVRVGSGFSWGAFCFGAVWAVAHRGGARLVGGLLALDGATWLLSSWLEAQAETPWQVLGSALDLGVAVWQGRRGHHWLRRAYRHQGARPG